KGCRTFEICYYCSIQPSAAGYVSLLPEVFRQRHYGWFCKRLMEGYEMMNKKIRKLAALCISAVTVLSLAGCGGGGHQAADIDPDTPVSEVNFTLKVQAELALIISPLHASTQHRNERMI